MAPKTKPTRRAASTIVETTKALTEKLKPMKVKSVVKRAKAELIPEKPLKTVKVPKKGKEPAKAKKTPWMEHLNKVAAENKTKTRKECMTLASASYTKA